VVNQNPPEGLYDKHDDATVRRLALQGHRSAARELVRRSKGCETLTAFFERMLTENDRAHLSAGQFNVLSDSFNEQWREAHGVMSEIVNVSVKTQPGLP
jgi:hypothetical protein